METKTESRMRRIASRHPNENVWFVIGKEQGPRCCLCKFLWLYNPKTGGVECKMSRTAAAYNRARIGNVVRKGILFASVPTIH